VKNGWVAVALMVGIAIWITHSVTKSGINDKMSDLKGQLTDAKQDRDKYQTMLAPFQAAALKIYTNEPLNRRLDLLANEMGEIPKLANVDLVINSSGDFVICDMPSTIPTAASNIVILTDRKISVGLYNESKYPAINAFVNFVAPIGTTNVNADGWFTEPQNQDGRNHWQYTVDHSIARYYTHKMSTVDISTNFTPDFFIGEFDIGADNAESKAYLIGFRFQTKK
jgi:hypothetical protein